MNKYVQLLFTDVSQEKGERLIAALSEEGFDGFEEEENQLKAFIRMEAFDASGIQQIAAVMEAGYITTVIEETNWNEVWESNFQPVIVDDFVAIRAHFHAPAEGVEQEIVITPKMSFGTGHHATTWLMINEMRSIDFNEKSVLDFGTGTGVLAILAKKLGAKKVKAIDNDEWSITNAEENIGRNGVGGIDLSKEDSASAEGRFDVILANINKHVILDNLSALKARLAAGGELVLSGLLLPDGEDVLAAATHNGLRLTHQVERHNWLLLRLSY